MKKVFLSLLVLPFIGCTNSDDLIQSPESRGERTDSHFISKEDAVEIATEWIGTLGTNGTRSNKKGVSTVKVFTPAFTSLTRSNDNDEALDYYIVNYENNGGFVVVASDTRVPPVYALADEGHLEINDTLENKGLALFFSSLPTTVPDSLICVNPIIPPVLPDPYPLEPSGPNVEVAPLLTKTVRKWHQGYPFNVKCDGMPVCCVALSCGMVMSYFEWPKKYKDHSYDWTKIKNEPYTSDISVLLKDLGTTENLSVRYGKNSSETFFSNCIRTFQNFGYKTPSYSKFNMNVAVGMLRAQQPILIDGRKVGDEIRGHTWVVDGLYTLSGLKSYFEDKPTYFLHCVWGEAGQSNGYFNFYNQTVGGRADVVGEEDSNSAMTTFSGILMIYDFTINN